MSADDASKIAMLRAISADLKMGIRAVSGFDLAELARAISADLKMGIVGDAFWAGLAMGIVLHEQIGEVDPDYARVVELAELAIAGKLAELDGRGARSDVIELAFPPRPVPRKKS